MNTKHPAGVRACGSNECVAGQRDGVLCANGECDRENGVRPDGVSALPTPKLCPGCAQYHGRNDCPVGWLAPAEPYGVPATVSSDHLGHFAELYKVKVSFFTESI